MPKRYAAQTEVPVEKTRSDIEQLLTRYGAEGFFYGSMNDRIVIGFGFNGQTYRMHLQMPAPHDKSFTHTPSGQWCRSSDGARACWEQACRQRWRSLLFSIKAKLVAVTDGISTIESEFLAFAMLPNGSTVGQWARPQLAAVYERGEMPPLLPGSVNSGVQTVSGNGDGGAVQPSDGE